MKIVPYYRVSYHGVYHAAGESFEIDSADKDDMSVHGVLVADEAEAEKTTKKPGRPKKEQ
jgi:hypothetical protein